MAIRRCRRFRSLFVKRAYEEMHRFVTSLDFPVRLRQTVSLAWEIFARKTAGGLLPVNKEASMQLQYAFILQQLLPMTLHADDERVEIELESTFFGEGGRNEIDILVTGKKEILPLQLLLK